MILIKTYIEQLSPALEESASLDGAGYLTCFFKIVLPLCKPIIATVVVFVAVGQWNSWFDNHIYTRANENLTTLQYLLYNYLNEAQRLAEQLKNAIQWSRHDAGYGIHFPERNPNDHHRTCIPSNLRIVSIHAEVFLKRNYGRCCKRLICEIEIKEMRNLWYLFIRIDSRGSFGK